MDVLQLKRTLELYIVRLYIDLGIANCLKHENSVNWILGEDALQIK